MQYQGVIIEESLSDKSVLGRVKIESTKVEPITPEHKTPWLKQWTLHTVLIDEDVADRVAEEISKSLDYSHNSAWYADFKNDKTHFIIFKDKIFKVDRSNKEEYQKATDYGLSLGIPSYQVDFAPNTIEWKR
jgi:hypothetical protein